MRCLPIVFLVCALFAAAPLLRAAEPAIAPADTDIRAYDPREEAHLPIAELERRTAAGDAKSQAELGARYGSGQGVKQDLPKAIDLLKAAAAKNDPDAQFFLGTAYSSGLGLAQNDTQAVMLYEQAAQQGHAPAKLALANAVMAGRGGIAPSMNSGLRYLWESAAEGYVPAMIQIGQLYQNGKDVDRNPRAAAYWYRRVLQLIPDVRTIYNLRLLIERRQVAWEAGDPGEPLASPEKPVQTAGDGPGKGAGQAKP